MTKETRRAILEDRYKRLAGSPKNIKCPGVSRKLLRRLRRENY